MRTLTRFLVVAEVLSLALVMTEPVLAQHKIEAPFRRRIVGGEPTDIKQHPWQVAFNIVQSTGTFLCGGSIVAQNWILSAKHCFINPPVDASNVSFKANVTDINKMGAWLKIEQIFLHPGQDLALIKLASAPQGRVIPLVSASSVIPLGEPLEVTGWGVTDTAAGTTSDVLRKAVVPLIDNNECNAPDAYKDRIKPHEMCAGHREGQIDSCWGDSGGPLVWHTADAPVLVGVVSWGDGCAERMKYGVYVRVNVNRDWIDRTIAENQGDRQ